MYFFFLQCGKRFQCFQNNYAASTNKQRDSFHTKTRFLLKDLITTSFKMKWEKNKWSKLIFPVDKYAYINIYIVNILSIIEHVLTKSYLCQFTIYLPQIYHYAYVFLPLLIFMSHSSNIVIIIHTSKYHIYYLMIPKTNVCLKIAQKFLLLRQLVTIMISFAIPYRKANVSI